ncbi:MAG: hypothetical protein ACK44M_11645, partial [Chloroflexus sp.]
TPLTRTRFSQSLQRWMERSGMPPTGLLPPPRPAEPASASVLPEELSRYAIPQVLVCQEATIATMLRANAFELELACPVYTANEWPLPAPIIAALHRAQQPRILLLHEASTDGLAWACRCMKTAPPALRVYPIGLRPRHAQALRLCAQRGLPSPTLTELALARDEVRWLRRGWQAELAAVHPIKLVRALRAIVYAAPTPVSWPERWRFFVNSGFMSWPMWKEPL